MKLPRQSALARDDIFHAVGSKPPQEKANIAEVVPPFVLTGEAHVHGVAHEVKRAVEAIDGFRTAQVGAAGTVHAKVIEVLIPNEQLKELDGMGRPAGDVTGQLFEHRESTFAAPVVDGLGDVGSSANCVRGSKIRSDEVREQFAGCIGGVEALGIVQEVVADQIADTGWPTARMFR